MFDEGEERGARVSKKGKKASLEDGEPPPVSLACVSTRGDRVSETVEDRATGPTQDATVVVPAGAANIELEPRSVGETTVAVGGARAKQASLDPRRLPACLPLTAIPFDPFESRQQQGAYTTRKPGQRTPLSGWHGSHPRLRDRPAPDGPHRRARPPAGARPARAPHPDGRRAACTRPGHRPARPGALPRRPVRPPGLCSALAQFSFACLTTPVDPPSRSWAAKEALYKALQPHFSPGWKDLSVLVPAHSRKPQVIFSPDGTLAGAGLTAHLSISHDGDYLVAGVVVERD